MVYPDGDQVTTSDPGGIPAQLGAAITEVTIKRPGVLRMLLPPKATATILIPLQRGASAQVGTEIDGEAWGVTTLDTALSEIGIIYGHLATATFSHPEPSAMTKIFADLLDEIGKSKCLVRVQTELDSQDTLTLANTETLGSILFDCLQSAASNAGILAVASVVGVIVGLADALVQVLWALVDTARGASRHLITVSAEMLPSGHWTDPNLAASTHSLGAAQLGMILAQVQSAVDVSLQEVGDGIYNSSPPTIAFAGGLYGTGTIRCFGAAVHVEAWKLGYSGLLPQDLLDGLKPRQRVPRWRPSIGATSWQRRGTLLAVDADLVVGFVNLCPTRDADQDAESVGEITSLYVLPDQGGHGIGRRLMQAGIQTLTAAGFHTATLWVLDTNTPAIGFYQAQGWRPDGATTNDVIGGAPIQELRFVRALAEVT